MTLVNTAVFVSAGVGLIVVLNAILRVLVTRSGTISSEFVDYDEPIHYELIDGVWTPVATADASTLGFATYYDVSKAQLDQFVLWSAALVVAFAVIAWLLSRWTVTRSLARIAQVTATARRITEEDLSQRLELAGPTDEVKELGDTIDSMLGRLQAAFDAQARFAANASHELRTPLTVTQASLEIPLEHGLIGAEARPDIERALEAARYSEELITALLDLASARSPAGREDVEVAQLVREVVDELRELAGTAEVEIDVDTDDAAPVRASRVLMRRAVHNLVENAIQHNVRGGLVRARVRVRDEAVEVEVENTGPMLDPGQVGELVEPFHRGPSNRIGGADGARRGYGLGLSIVTNIASAHHGGLRLSARTDGGLTAVLSLPANQDPTE